MNDSIEGIRLPGPPRHPTIRRVHKPQPFQRPSTTVVASAVARTWGTVPADRLACGDTVPGVGTITARSPHTATGTVTVYGGLGNSAAWPAEELVYAFTAAGE